MTAIPGFCRARSVLLWSGLVLMCGAMAAWAQVPTFEEPLSPRIANYDIKATLDDEARRIDGEMVLTWNNPSEDHVEDLQFHLYLNAFKNAASTMSRERLHVRAAGTDCEPPKELPWSEEKTWGWCRITRMEVDGVDVTDRIAFYQPDDDNVDDQTVVRVELPTPIAPRATARIHMEFEIKIPESNIRVGWWQDDFVLMSHWIPKIGVYETPGVRFVPADAPHGQWNCHQFHYATEFYADYGVYDVQITVPEEYVVGTSGLILESKNNDDGTQTVVAHAEDVHEFAWVADAQFREATAVWQNPQTKQVVDIRLLYQPDHESVVPKYLESVKSTLTYVDDWLGPGAYPYPNITVVDPRAGSGAPGMEYPTLITGGAFWWAERLFGDGLRITEQVTIHEFLHQFWYGIVASNEFEEAWLDEGLTTYSENRISSHLFGEKTSVINWWGVTLGSFDATRAAYVLSEHKNDGTLAMPSFSHWRPGVSFGLSYSKAGVMLRTLENYLGRERFDKIIRTYFQRFKFHHPCRHDFRAVANEVAGEDLDRFFDQLLDEATSLDYAVASIANVPLDSYEDGFLGEDYGEDAEAESGASDEALDDEEDDDEEGCGEDDHEPHHCTVVFRRVGEMIFPMETLVEFSDGEVVRDTWDGRGRVKIYHFTRPAKVVRAAVDPDLLVPLDVDRFNNSLRIEGNELVENKCTLRGMFWMQSLLQFFSILG